MESKQVNELLQRLAHLEYENRWWKALGIAVSGILCIVLLVGATGNKVPDEIRAKRFVLVDEDGEVRGSIGVFEDSTALLLAGKGGKGTITMAIDPDGSRMLMLDDSILLNVQAAEGYASLDFIHKEHRRSSFRVLSDGSSILEMRDKNLKSRVALALANAGPPTLVLKDENEFPRAMLSVTNQPNLTLFSEEGRITAEFGSPTLIDPMTGNPIVKSPALVFLREGKVIWSAP